MFKTGMRINDISIEFRRIIIKSFLGWVKWWLLHDEVPFMISDLFGNLQVFEVIGDVNIKAAPVCNSIVNWVVFLLLWVFVLS